MLFVAGKDTIGMGLDNSAPTELQRVASDDKETAFVGKTLDKSSIFKSLTI
jgi:hypothetical protein